jgi:hypothetical protein
MFAAVGAQLVVFVLGGIVFFGGFFRHMTGVGLVGFVLMLVSAFIPRIAWRAFGNALLAYAFAARIPVVIVMYSAMSANGGHGWGTHYDVATPGFTVTSFRQKFVDLAVLPQTGSLDRIHGFHRWAAGIHFLRYVWAKAWDRTVTGSVDAMVQAPHPQFSARGDFDDSGFTFAAAVHEVLPRADPLPSAPHGRVSRLVLST